MQTSTKSAAARLTETTLAAMEKLIADGVKPWNKPWCMSVIQGQMSAASGKPYSAANQFIMKFQQMGREHTPGANDEYSTYRAIVAEGFGDLLRGAKSVAMWKPRPSSFVKHEQDENGDDVETTVHFMRYSIELVFNRQALGLPKKYVAPEPARYSHKPDELAENIIKNYCEANDIKLNADKYSNKAFQSNDGTITVPALSRFSNMDEYYSTVFHELVHSTAIRGLSRKCHTNYAKTRDHRAQEELIAELGAATLTEFCGINKVADSNSAAYLDSWSKALDKEKAEAFLYALKEASKAVELILGELLSDLTPQTVKD